MQGRSFLNVRQGRSFVQLAPAVSPVERCRHHSAHTLSAAGRRGLSSVEPDSDDRPAGAAGPAMARTSRRRGDFPTRGGPRGRTRIGSGPRAAGAVRTQPDPLGRRSFLVARADAAVPRSADLCAHHCGWRYARVRGLHGCGGDLRRGADQRRHRLHPGAPRSQGNPLAFGDECPAGHAAPGRRTHRTAHRGRGARRRGPPRLRRPGAGGCPPGRSRGHGGRRVRSDGRVAGRAEADRSRRR